MTIEGYSQDAMEPFISPDGNYLFFNNSNSLPQTNLYYATRIDDVTFQFQGEIGGANATGLNAVPSMDVNNIFYFVSTQELLADSSRLSTRVSFPAAASQTSRLCRGFRRTNWAT